MTAFERIGRGDRHGLLPYQTTIQNFAMERLMGKACPPRQMKIAVADSGVYDGRRVGEDGPIGYWCVVCPAMETGQANGKNLCVAITRPEAYGSWPGRSPWR